MGQSIESVPMSSDARKHHNRVTAAALRVRREPDADLWVPQTLLAAIRDILHLKSLSGSASKAFANVALCPDP